MKTLKANNDLKIFLAMTGVHHVITKNEFNQNVRTELPVFINNIVVLATSLEEAKMILSFTNTFYVELYKVTADTTILGIPVNPKMIRAYQTHLLN